MSSSDALRNRRGAPLQGGGPSVAHRSKAFQNCRLGILFVAIIAICFVLSFIIVPAALGTAHGEQRAGSTSPSKGLQNRRETPGMAGSDVAEFFVAASYRKERLTKDELAGLVGMYYVPSAATPSVEKLSKLQEANVKIISQDQLPQKMRAIPPGGIVTMVGASPTTAAASQAVARCCSHLSNDLAWTHRTLTRAA